MDATNKPLQGRRPSVSASALRTAVPKTPLARMNLVTELSRVGRQFMRMGKNARANTGRAR